MYLIIFEDNELILSKNITSDEKTSCDDGYLIIVDMSNYTQYYNGQWHAIEEMKYK